MTKLEVYLPASKSISEWSSEGFHQIMLDDALRVDVYKKAIKETIQCGDVVLDLGTGTGILARFALEAGAKKVYGIEVSNIGKQAEKSLAKDFPGKFTLIAGVSFGVTLPQKVDVIISEIIGNFGDNENIGEILNDASMRFLKQGGTMLPMDLRTFVCPVFLEDINNDIAVQHFSLYPCCTKKHLADPFQSYYDALIPCSCELAEAQEVAAFHFDGVDEVSYKKDIEFTVTKNGLFTGLKGYFKAQLSSKVELDISGETIGENASSSWQHAYFPIDPSFEVNVGDKIRMSIERTSRGGMSQAIYHWQGNVARGGVQVSRFEHWSR